MRPVYLVVVTGLGLGLAVANLAFWWWIVRTGETRFRKRVERRYQVVITRSFRGHWQVSSGPGSKGKHLLIELLQLAYFMGAMFVWSIAMGFAVLVFSLLERIA
jgi:hypothetical protein